MNDKHRKGDAQSKFYSLPLCVANTAIIKRGISEKSRGDLRLLELCRSGNMCRSLLLRPPATSQLFQLIQLNLLGEASLDELLKIGRAHV